VRVAIRGAQVVAERYHPRPPGPPVRILQDVAADRHQPGAKLALAAEPPQRAERPDEGLLHQVVHVRLERAGAGQEAGERARVTADQFGRRRLVATAPGGDQRRIGRNRGDGLGGSHALGTVDVRDAVKLRP